jgi:hypothetical protein
MKNTIATWTPISIYAYNKSKKEERRSQNRNKMEHLQHQAMKYPDYRSQTQKA